jgi:hypothetical protein
LIEVERSDLRSIVNKLEEIGFVGIEIPYYLLDGKYISVSGFKGKHGPCYNTGLSAIYNGSALAAFDDDNHLLTRGKESAICEKTGNIYKFPPYRGLINIIGEPGESERKQDLSYEEFNLYSLDDELSTLYARLRNSNIEKNRHSAFYPGPFKTLVLADGTIIKRGEVNSVAESLLNDLVRHDRFIKLKSGSGPEPVFFQNEYEDHGPRCLQMDQKVNESNTEVHQVDLKQIDLNSLKLASRLRGLIDQDRKYFILTGSDPADELGCCPSDEVGEANKLVSAGLLSSVTQESYGDTCPVSYYAFRDEIFVQDGEIEFSKNAQIRREVRQLLRKSKEHGYRRIIRWILLGFVGISLVFAFLKMSENFNDNKHYSLFEQLSVVNEDAIIILLFHNRVRCDMCLNMEQHVQSLLQSEYAEEISNNRIHFFLLDMNATENINHVDRFGLYTASVIFVEMDNREEKQAIVLDDIWKDHDNEAAFKERIRRELEILLSK